MSEGAIDLPILDRDVRRAVARVEQVRALLARGTAEAREEARAYDPFDARDGLRHTAVKATYHSLAKLQPSMLDVPLRDALIRWVHELLQARVAQDLTLAEATALHAIDSRLPPSRIAELERARSKAPNESQRAPDLEFVTYHDAFAAIVRAPNETRAASSLERAADLALPVAAVRREARERRFEASRRLGLANTFALATKADVAVLARALLDATEPLAVDLLEQARKKAEARWHASSAMLLGLARGT